MISYFLDLVEHDMKHCQEQGHGSHRTLAWLIKHCEEEGHRSHRTLAWLLVPPATFAKEVRCRHSEPRNRPRL